MSHTFSRYITYLYVVSQIHVFIYFGFDLGFLKFGRHESFSTKELIYKFYQFKAKPPRKTGIEI